MSEVTGNFQLERTSTGKVLDPSLEILVVNSFDDLLSYWGKNQRFSNYPALKIFHSVVDCNTLEAYFCSIMLNVMFSGDTWHTGSDARTERVTVSCVFCFHKYSTAKNFY